MHTTRLILTYLLTAIIVVVLGGIAGWYFFLHTPQATSTATDTARGLASPQISFSGGSTQENISAVVGDGPKNTSITSSSPLWQVDKTPVAGMRFVKFATTSALQYVERANGYVFTANPIYKSSTRLTDTLIPKIYEAFISPNGSVIERSLDESGAITTFMGILNAAASTATSTTQDVLGGTYITKNIQSISVNPTAQSIFYLVANATGGVDGMTAQWNGSKPKRLFSSTITHWTPMWLSDGRIIITESPADDLPGYSYTVGNDGSMTLLVGNVPGMTLLPRTSSKALLYGSSSNGILTLFTQGPASSTPTALPLHTIADKCVWLEGKSLIAYCAVPTTAPPAHFLDLWHRGAIHTSDDWYRVDVSTGTTALVYSPKTSNAVDIDVESPVIDPSGNYIAFINASDKSLWMLKIPQ